MCGPYISHMRRTTLALAALPVILSSCAIGAYFPPITPLERATNGLYEGEGRGLTGRVPYRLTLTIQEKAGRANGVLVNLESKKTYTGSGTFRRTIEGADLDMRFYENGDKFRAAIHAQMRDTSIIGQLKTALLGQELFPYNINFKKVEAETAP